METSNLSCLGVGTTSSQTSLEEKRLSGVCSSRMLLGSSSTTGSIQSCDVTDILSRSNNGIAGGFLSPATTSSNLDCTLQCSVTVAVPPLGSSFRSIGGSRPKPEIRITTNNKNKQLEELLHMSENERFDYDDDSGNNTPNIFLNQEDSQENPNEDDYDDDDDDDNDDEEEVGECDSDFDGLDLEDDDHDPVPLGDILDKLQANASLNYSHCPKKESPDNLIQLHAAQEDNDSQTISATVNVAALDLSDPDSIYRHLSELNDTVLRVSAKNSSAPGSGQQSPISFLNSPDIGNDASQCQDAMTPNSSTRSSSPANSRTENSDLSSITGKIGSISVNGTPCSSTQIFLNKNSTFLPSNIQLPTSPLALAVSCSTPSPSMLCSPLPSVSRSSSVPCSPNVLTKSSSSSNLATKSTPQSCAICYKVFSNASALAKHRLTHSEERRYHCNICSKAFKRQDHLNGHLLTHRSTKPFACQVEGCGKSYCDARSLRRHKENHHATGLKHHQHHHHTLVSIPTINASAQIPTPTLAIASKSESVNVESTSPTVTRSTVGDTKIMFSSKGLTAQQLQLIEQLLKDSRSGKIVSLPTNPNLSTLQPHPPPPPPMNISFPLSQNSSKPTCNISSPQISPVISTLNIAVKRVASPEKGCIPIGPDKPVECTICNRKFKNIPALNGHMRLHGGYYKKDSEGKKILTSAALRQNLKGAKLSSTFSKNNLKRKCGITLEETSAKKTSLCPVNLQTSLSNLQPITPASLSGMCLSTNNTTNMINLTSTLEQKVPFESQARFSSSVCPIPQPSLAFQSLPPPDTNKLLENLEKKNFALMLIKNEDVHKFSTYDGSLKYAKDKAPMKLKALPAHHSKGIGTKETRTAVVCESKSTQNQVTYTIGLPPIALPTKPVPKLQLEESKSSTKFTPQLNSPLVTQALKVKFPSATEQIQDSKDFLCTLQRPIEFKNTGSTCVTQGNKENTNLIFFPDSQDLSRNSDMSEVTFHGMSPLAKTEAASADASEKGTTLSSNHQMNYFHNNNFEEFIESNTSLSQFLQSSSCQSVLNQLRASPLTKSHLMLRVDNSSDKNPKIGKDHQADIPDQIIKCEEAFDMEEKGVLVWSPDDLFDEKSVEDYLQVASSCAILQGSHNEELALELLHNHSGKVFSALQDLLSLTNRTPDEDTLSIDTDFEDESEESDMDMDAGTAAQSQRMKAIPWTEHEVNTFYEGLVKYKKNFSKISHFVETKTVKECVEFYYLWKNFCHDEAHSFKNIFYSECSGNTKYSAMYDPAGTETFAIKIQEEKPESTSS